MNIELEQIRSIVANDPAAVVVFVGICVIPGVAIYLRSSARRRARRDEMERLELERLRREVPPIPR